MTKVTERCSEGGNRPIFICDFSPPRSGDIGSVDQANIDADFISVAYNPGRAVRADSAIMRSHFVGTLSRPRS